MTRVVSWLGVTAAACAAAVFAAGPASAADAAIVATEVIGYDEGRQCATGQLQLEQLITESPYGQFHCFALPGTTGGELAVELPGVFGARGGSQPVTVTAELSSGTREYQVPVNRYVPISPGSGSDWPEATVVSLRIG